MIGVTLRDGGRIVLCGRNTLWLKGCLQRSDVESLVVQPKDDFKARVVGRLYDSREFDFELPYERA